MKKRLVGTIVMTLIIILLLIFILFFIRFFSETQLDDVTPGIQCDKELIKKSDVLFVIPKLNNIPISENLTWCKNILALDKKLSLHGVTHEYNEFETNRTQEYLQEGIDIFEKCFNYTPEAFKPPRLKINSENKKLIKTQMKLNIYLNQIFHKVYHCSDTGKFSNKFIDIF